MLKKNNILLEKIFYNYLKNPNKIIISDANKSLTWKELVDYSLYYSLKFSKIKSKYIPILVNRKIETIIVILAIILANKVFCPMSCAIPNYRRSVISKMLKSNLIVNCSKIKISKKMVNNKKNKTESLKKIFIKNNLKDEFYVLFTSGSTGAPKGVKLSYENILNTIIWSKSYINWNKKDKIGIASQFSFDLSIFDLFSALFFNIQLFIFSNPQNPIQNLNEINKEKITSILSVPVFFSNFYQYNLLKKNFFTLRRIMSAGDFFSPQAILEWHKYQKKIKIFNGWGPTETSILNSFHLIKRVDIKELKKGQPAPVGKSHKLMRICILGNKKRIIKEKNKIGEICMLGKSVSVGYVGNIKNSKNYTRLVNERAFLTGDLGYFDNFNNLHIVGRKDHMIKIAGYRIDGLEIQKITNKIKGVLDSVTFDVELHDRLKTLCLAILTNKRLNIQYIKKYLSKYLPSYSIPKRIVFLKKFPVNVNNKVNRNKLSELVHSSEV
jgi:acyl-coenzyme A synthetase/AMP-(fatty) acid ligase